MISELIKKNYGFEVINISRMAGGWSSKVYLIETNQSKYVLKDVPVHGTNHPEDEGEITNFLLQKGLKVSKLVRTKNDKFVWTNGDKQYHLQHFVDGDTYELNTAPIWFMKKSAQTLGMIHKELGQLQKFPTGMGYNFFKYSSPDNTKKSYIETLEHAKKVKDGAIIQALESRISQIDKLKTISLDCEKFTCSNTHGDYYIYQMICKDKDFTVIDWTSACVHPICWEIIRSFAYADPFCGKGGFNVDGFIEYIKEYLRYNNLNKYDLKMMPYMFYYQLGVCNYYHSYYFDEGIDMIMALKISDLATNLMDWFYKNVDELADILSSL